MTNAIAVLQSAAAYKAVMIQLLLGEASFTAEKLALPIPTPIEKSALTEVYVSPEKFGVGGTLRTTNFTFTFSRGSLHTVERLDILHGKASLREKLLELSQHPTLVNEQGAYALARGWLQSINVDVDRLEATHKPGIKRRRMAGSISGSLNAETAKPLPDFELPIFDVYWGERTVPGAALPVEIGVLGHRKELLYLRLKPPTFSARNPIAPPSLPVSEIPDKSGYSSKKPVSESVWRRPDWAPAFDASPDELNSWYAERLGGSNKLEAIRSPETVTAVLIKKQTESKLGDYSASAFEIIGSSVEIKVSEAMPVCSWLGDLSTFNLHLFPFAPDYCARLTFKRGNDTVECLVAVNETFLRLSSGEHFVPWLSYQGKPSLRNLLQQAFPEHDSFK